MDKESFLMQRPDLTQRPEALSGLSRIRAIVAGLSLAAITAACGDGMNTDDQSERRPSAQEQYVPDGTPYFVDNTLSIYENVNQVLAETTDPETRQKLESLLQTPMARWLVGGTTEQVSSTVADTVARASEQNSVPVFAAYNFPNRDLGGESAGGAANTTEYINWITAVSDAIGDQKAIVILEPDALALSTGDLAYKTARLKLLRQALEIFAANPGTDVFLDGGHSRWLSAAELAGLLNQIDQGDGLVGGISLNVSNSRPPEELEIYALAVQQAFGEPLRVMFDNSMNGAQNPPDPSEWCNPVGEQIGSLPDKIYAPIGDLGAEHFFVKIPGESDGSCGTSQSPAGIFDKALLFRQIAATS